MWAKRIARVAEAAATHSYHCDVRSKINYMEFLHASQAQTFSQRKIFEQAL